MEYNDRIICHPKETKPQIIEVVWSYFEVHPGHYCIMHSAKKLPTSVE